MPRFTARLLPLLTALLLTFAAAGCSGDDPADAAPTHAAEEDHEHGPGTHTHAATAADTAGTYVDTTGTFFDDDPDAHHERGDADGHDENHEHGEETHTHE